MLSQFLELRRKALTTFTFYTLSIHAEVAVHEQEVFRHELYNTKGAPFVCMLLRMQTMPNRSKSCVL